MKKVMITLAVLMTFSAAAFAYDITIEGIQVLQTSGSTASFNALTGTLVWSAGATGRMWTDAGYYEWEQAVVTATFTGLNDLSSGGLADATFTSGTWKFMLGTNDPLGTGQVEISGILASPYRETEQGTTAGVLDGSALAIVQNTFFDYGYFGYLWGVTGVELQWGDGVNMLGNLLSSTQFSSGYPLNNFASNWQSGNLSASLWAVPEPATISLLGLGAIAFLKRKNSK